VRRVVKANELFIGRLGVGNVRAVASEESESDMLRVSDSSRPATASNCERLGDTPCFINKILR
jgi:hypothetical protein